MLEALSEMLTTRCPTASVVTFVLLLSFPGVYARGSCDPLVPEFCLLPFPNSFFTVPSDNSETGVLVDISSDSFPKDSLGRRIGFSEWNTFGEGGSDRDELEDDKWAELALPTCTSI